MNLLKSCIAIILVVLLTPVSSGARELVIDNNNDNKFLVVFVSGLGGAETWDNLISFMTNDASLNKFDADVFDALASGGNIIQSSAELKRLLKTGRLSEYQEIIIVAHSIGGILTKDYLLKRLETSTPSEMREKFVLFIGTPHVKDTFTVSWLKKFGSYIIYFMLSDLTKDALDSPEIKKINNRWIDTVEKNADKYIKNLALFGNDDKVVRPEDLSNIFLGEYLVIAGTHLAIAQPDDESGCTYQIFRQKLLNVDSSVAELECAAE